MCDLLVCWLFYCFYLCKEFVGGGCFGVDCFCWFVECVEVFWYLVFVFGDCCCGGCVGFCGIDYEFMDVVDVILL